MTLRNQIIELHQQGKSYNEISNILNCSKGTISYHCNADVKSKTKENRKKWRKKNTLSYKIHNFKYLNSAKKKLYGIIEIDPGLNYESLIKKFGSSPKCYLTGIPINLNNSNEYSLDHIIPISKGGKCSLENCGLTSTKANQVKTDLTYKELIIFCRSVLKEYKKTIKG